MSDNDPVEATGVSAGEQRAVAALAASGIGFAITRHGPVSSLAEAAAARGVQPGDIVNTLVVRRGEGDHLFVLVPGDATTAWPVIADATLAGRPVSMGGGAHGVAAAVAADDVVRALGAELADVTDAAG